MAGRRRPAATFAAAAALSLVAAACGSNSGRGPSPDDRAQGYYRAIGQFCTDVRRAASQVQGDAQELRRSAADDPTRAVKGFGGSLQGFADDIESASDRLRTAPVPQDLKSFNDRVLTGIGGVVAKLDAAAQSAKDGDVAALRTLGEDLDAVRLPALPKDVAANAESCGDLQN